MNNCYAESFKSTSWQGEWGKWQKNADGYSYYGANISIRDCQPDSSCSFSFDFVYPKASTEKITNLGCFFEGKFYITSSTSAIGTAASCIFKFSIDKTNPTTLYVSKPNGTNCTYFCTVKKIRSYPQTYTLRTHNNYASIANKEICYADSSTVRQIWCKNSELTELNRKLNDNNYDANFLLKKCTKEQNIKSVSKRNIYKL